MPLIALLPGDGIGPEIVSVAVSVLHRTAELFDLSVETRESLVGGAGLRRNRASLAARHLGIVQAKRRNSFGCGRRGQNTTPLNPPICGLNAAHCCRYASIWDFLPICGPLFYPRFWLPLHR